MSLLDRLAKWMPPVIILAFVTSACAPAPASPTSAAAPSPAAKGLEEKLDEYLRRLSGLGFSGSVLVAEKGKIVLSKGYGLLDQSGAAPITPETVFAIGSNAKPFTAAAVLKLQDQGRLSVNDPVRRFLPDAPPDKAEITLHQLLTHSSGLAHSGVFSGDFENVSRPEAVSRILQSKLLFSPGVDSSYSDYGYILLAAIIELASGRPYRDYLRTELFEPAGMTHTGWWGNDPVLKGQPMATGYSGKRVIGEIPTLPGPSWAIMGAGGMVSTVMDLYRWHLALQAGGVLSKESLEAYSVVQYRLDERGGEGYGWMVIDEPGQRARAHAGDNPHVGHSNVMRWFMDADVLFILSASNEEWNAEKVVPDLVKIYFGQRYGLQPFSGPLVATAPAAGGSG